MKRIAALLLACSASFANAQFMSAQDLREHLEKGGHHRTLAAGYIAGVTDVHYGKATCITDGTTASTLTNTVYKALVAMPEFGDVPAEFFVINVLAELWPCKKPESPKPQENKPMLREPRFKLDA